MKISQDSEDGRRSIQSVARALNILKFIGKSDNSAGLTNISAGVGLSHSTTHNLLRTLKQSGFIMQSEPTGKYSLGLEILELAKSIEQNFSLRAVAREPLESLSHKYNETTHLSILSDGEVVYVDKTESSQSIRLMSYIGKRNPANTTGVGKVLLSSLDESKLDKIIEEKGLPPRTKSTITDAKRLKSALKLIRSQGYALDDGEYEEGVWCAAAPIKDLRGVVVAAMSISFPANRIENFDKSEVIQDVMNSAQNVSSQLGYR